jgi:predicted MFS family arabinose efflux permease
MNIQENTARDTLRRILSRDFVLAFLALFSFLAATFSLNPTLPLYLKRLGSPEREIGMLMGVVGIASLVSRLIVGGALLRYSEKRIMIVGTITTAISFASYLVLRPFWPFLIMRFFQGTAFACIDTAVLAVIVRVTPLKFRSQALGYVLLASPLAMAISSSSGVYLSNTFGFSILVLTCIGLALCSFAFSCTVRGNSQARSLVESSKGISQLIDLRILPPALLTFLTSFSLGGLFVFIPLYAAQCGISNPGVFFTAVAVMLFVGRILGGKILTTFKKEHVVPLCVSTMALALVVLSFSKTLPFIVLVGLLWGAGLSFVSPTTMAYALEYAGASGGPALGTYQMFMDLGLAIGPVVMGILVPTTGYPIMYLILALVCLANVIYFLFYLERTRQNRKVLSQK